MKDNSGRVAMLVIAAQRHLWLQIKRFREFLAEIMFRREVEILVPRKPKEGIDWMGCLIYVDDLTDAEVEQLKAVFSMKERRMSIVRRQIRGRERRYLGVSFPLLRKVQRVWPYRPADEFGEWLMKTMDDEFEMSISLSVKKTKDVHAACLA